MVTKVTTVKIEYTVIYDEVTNDVQVITPHKGSTGSHGVNVGSAVQTHKPVPTIKVDLSQEDGGSDVADFIKGRF
ncbi:hypothetical protein DT73_13140 [Mangrovibacter sp. MFB070]|uniref:hypothetical protein n=1 Tax=Mangrovibacter sp. MFB070 TaxID=1224318 RepID=UPI0004D53761|nr:hypothetical protein [Mangrovibacter sp. MFB070]KEA51873.1 hypothetical protein DT73_13140 [Mangrovibacter sp. MFB070]